MRTSKHMTCVASGYGVPFSMVAKRFDNEIVTVEWIDEESDDNWVKVRSSVDGCVYTIHSIQLTPLPKEAKP